jgi:RNA polymerase sigma factor (sigma-70 family)
VSGNVANGEPKLEAVERAAWLRAVVETNHGPLIRMVAVLVAKSYPGLPWPEVMDRASETLNEAVHEALRHAGGFDPSRSATAWIRGIAANVLATRRRVEFRAARSVSATVLGDDAWAAALGQRCAEPVDEEIAGRLDLEQALGRLSPEDRRTIELRYYRGLDGSELARALGVPTQGAARVRVCRALQALRSRFSPAGEEVSP